MKKTVLIVLSALFTFAACQKAPVAQIEEQTEVKEIIFKISVNHSDDTKAVKTGWANGDKVYVFFQGVTGVKYATLTRDGDNWNASLTGIDASTLAAASPSNMYAVFFPYEQPVIASDGKSGVTFKTDNHAPHYAATAGLSIYTYYMTANSTCSVTVDGETATLTGTLNMAIPAGYVQFFINTNSTNYNEDYRYRLSIQGVMPTACVSYSGGTFGTKQLKAAQPMWGYAHGTDGVAFSGVIDDTWESTENSHVVYLFDTDDAAKWISISGKKLVSYNTVNFSTNHPSACSEFDPSDPDPSATWKYAAKVPETVTVGLTDWGTYNLGATAAGTAEANYGWYFLWGDIIPQRGTTGAPSGYGGNSYYASTVAYEALYNKLINLVADGENHWEIYDAAKAFLGSSWRLPTAGWRAKSVGYESVELRNAGTEWSVNNSLLTNTNQGDSQYYITLPAAGLWNGGSFQRGGDQGTIISSITKDYGGDQVDRMRAFNINHSSVNYPIVPTGLYARCVGLSVRPVKDATVTTPTINGTTGEGLLGGKWD